MSAFVVGESGLRLKVVSTGGAFVPVILDGVLVALIGMPGVVVRRFKR